MINFIDSHNHIKTNIPINSIYNTYNMDNIHDLNGVSSKNIFIGIHPLYISKNIDLSFIEQLVVDKGYNIGEVGLDKRGENRGEQLELLKWFLDIANKYSRSLSFHCVKSWGNLSTLINRGFNRDIPHLFHGFSGSREIYNELSKGNSFFSFSLRELTRDPLIELIKSIPMEKLLIESDILEDKFLSLGEASYLNLIKQTYETIARIKNIPIDTVIYHIDKNFKEVVKE